MDLSDREAEVLALVGERLTNAEIASRLVLGVRTVESHVSALLRKLGEPDRRGLAVRAEALGLTGGAVAVADLPTARERPLPRRTSAILGRRDDLDDVAAALETHRLVTVLGPGGVGKTRVAVEIASARQAVFVDLTVLRAGAPVEEVAVEISRACGLAELRGDLLDGVCAYLGARRRLVVLDNCEHILEGAARAVSALLDAGASVLATSRERLTVPGEHLYRLGPLDADAARQLFVERARLVDDEAELDDSLVAEVCERLDGLPLALELAAARLGAMGLRDLVDRLDAALELLDAGDRTSARHRSLRAAIGWSHDLLDPADQVVYRRLGVLGPQFRLATAESVAGPGPVAASIARLVEASLLSRRGGRYRQLELIRGDAAERLAASGELRTTQARLVEWALASLDSCEDDDDPDLRAAFEAAIEIEHPALVGLTQRLLGWLQVRHRWPEALAVGARLAHHSTDPSVAIEAAEWALTRYQGDQAVALFERAADVAIAGERWLDAAKALAWSVEVHERFAGTCRVEMSSEEQAARCDQAEAWWRRSGATDPLTAAVIATARGWKHHGAGAPESIVNEAVRSSEASGDPRVLGSALDLASSSLAESRARVAARSLVDRRVRLLDELGDGARDRLERMDTLGMAADICLLNGDFADALELSNAQAEFDEGNGGLAFTARCRVPEPLLFAGRFDEALSQSALVLDSWNEFGRPRAAYLFHALMVGGVVLGYRGLTSERFFDAARASRADASGSMALPTIDITFWSAEVELHHGRVDRAAELLDGLAAPDRSWRSGRWSALRAEIFGGADIDIARDLVVEDRFAEAVLARAVGDLEAAHRGFVAIGARYQAARTALRFSDARRHDALADYAELGLTAPR